MAITTTRMNRIGRLILLNFSMPDFTPRATMVTVAARKARWQAMGSLGRAMNRANEPVKVSGAWWVNSSRSACTRYSRDQPPTTL